MNILQAWMVVAATTLALTPSVGMAVNFTTEFATYSDVASLPRSTQIAISVLSEAQIITGNPNGTYQPYSLLNRAEFITLALRLGSTVLSSPVVNAGAQTTASCFADVRLTDWYAAAVCTAQKIGIVEGYAIDQAPIAERQFKPSQSVTYAEAVKMLVESVGYDVPALSPNQPWYAPYIAVANTKQINLRVSPATVLTRAQIAELVALFYTYEQGVLSEYTRAQQGIVLSSSSNSSSSSNVTTVPVVSSSTLSMTTSSASSHTTYDLNTDTQVRSNFIVLGTPGPSIGAATIFSANQPTRITNVTVTLAGASSAVAALQIFTNNGEYLGNATRTSNTVFDLPLQTKEFTALKQQEVGIYIRPLTKALDSGGVSGESIQVASIGITAEGEWDNTKQTVLDTSVYPLFETTTAQVLHVSGGSRTEDIFLAGNGVRIGGFTFTGEAADAASTIAVTDLYITANKTAAVTLANIQLRDNASGAMATCVFTTQIECTNLPDSLGNFEDATRSLTIYADVSAPVGEAYLQLTLNSSGLPTSPGAMHWTDGITNHTWVFGDAPFVQSTIYRR
jgi:hypothetical protein